MRIAACVTILMIVVVSMAAGAAQRLANAQFLTGFTYLLMAVVTTAAAVKIALPDHRPGGRNGGPTTAVANETIEE